MSTSIIDSAHQSTPVRVQSTMWRRRGRTASGAMHCSRVSGWTCGCVAGGGVGSCYLRSTSSGSRWGLKARPLTITYGLADERSWSDIPICSRRCTAKPDPTCMHHSTGDTHSLLTHNSMRSTLCRSGERTSPSPPRPPSAATAAASVPLTVTPCCPVVSRLCYQVYGTSAGGTR